MSVIRNLSIRKKLVGSFSIVSLLLLTVLLVGLNGFSTMNSHRDFVTNVIAPKLDQGQIVQVDVAQLDAAQNAYLADPSLRPNFTKDQNSFEHDIAHLEAIGNDARDQQLENGITKAYHAFIAADNKVWAAKKAGHDTLANHIMLTVADPTIGKLDAAAAAYTKGAKSDWNDANAKSSSASSQAKTMMIGAGAIALVIAVALAILLSELVMRGLRPVVERLGMLEKHCATDLEAALARMAQGDLTVEVVPVTPLIENPSRDEVGQVASSTNAIRDKMVSMVGSYNETRQNLAEMIAEISRNASALSASAQQMASTSEEAGRAVTEIASAVTEVAAGAERQVSMIGETQIGVQQTADAATETHSQALHGIERSDEATAAIGEVKNASHQVSETIRELSAKSDRIGGIVETITGIAAQTNLLALNAAIEAARAGEQGRGFAVVAEEVRQLAEESQQAAGEISGLISEIQSETERAVETSTHAGELTERGAETVTAAQDAFRAIGGQVEQMAMLVDGISRSATEVVSVAEASSAAAEEVSASTEQTSASTQEIAATAGELAQTAAGLEQLVSRFTV
ncbi:MAG: methyl-accepting chemotaxis protein [Gaiellales bacterium]